MGDVEAPATAGDEAKVALVAIVQKQRHDPKRTISLNRLFVAFATSDICLQILGLVDNLLNGNNPTVSLAAGGSFELVGVVANLEGEIGDADLGDSSGLGLEHVSCEMLESLSGLLPKGSCQTGWPCLQLA